MTVQGSVSCPIISAHISFLPALSAFTRSRADAVIFITPTKEDDEIIQEQTLAQDGGKHF